MPPIYYTTTTQQLRQRVATFNACLRMGQEKLRWPKMKGGMRNFVFDPSTEEFAIGKFAGYWADGPKADFDLSHYVSISHTGQDPTRADKRLCGGDARTGGIEGSLGLAYKDFKALSAKEQAALLPAFVTWYTQFFEKDSAKARAKCQSVKFLVIP